MSVEERNGHLYTYTKKREGKRVRSRYVGVAGRDDLMHALDLADETRRRHQVSEQIAREAAPYEGLEATLDELAGITRLMLDSMYVRAGYHQHKYQWRRKRVATGDTRNA